MLKYRQIFYLSSYKIASQFYRTQLRRSKKNGISYYYQVINRCTIL